MLGWCVPSICKIFIKIGHNNNVATNTWFHHIKLNNSLELLNDCTNQMLLRKHNNTILIRGGLLESGCRLQCKRVWNESRMSLKFQTAVHAL